MAVLWFTLCAVLMVTVVTSTPLCLNVGEDSSKSSESRESTESSSMEETATRSGPPQPAVTDMPNTVEPDRLNASLLPTAVARPSSATLNTSSQPYQEDPQTSTDIDTSDDPALGVDISKDMPDSDVTRDFLDADDVHVVPGTEGSLHPGPLETEIGAKQINVTSEHQGSPTLPPTQKFSKVTTDAPVCSTVPLTTPKPPPLRGDNK